MTPEKPRHDGEPFTRQWTGTLSRVQAVQILDRATDKDDPFWESVVQDFYDEEADTMPTIMDVLAALGVTEAEYREASGADNIDWPASPATAALGTQEGLLAQCIEIATECGHTAGLEYGVITAQRIVERIRALGTSR